MFVDPIGDARLVPRAEIEPWLVALQFEAYVQMIEEYWRLILANADSTVTQAALASLCRTPKEAVLSALDNIFVFNPAAALLSYQGPMQTIVSGLPDDPGALHHVIPGLPHVALPGTSHWLQMDQPEEFNRLMEEFLRTLSTE